MNISLLKINGKVVEIDPGFVVPVRSQFLDFFTYTIVVNNGKTKYHIQPNETFNTSVRAKQKMKEQVAALRKKHGLL